MGHFSKIDVERDDNYMRFNVTTMKKYGYTGPVKLIPTEYSSDGRLMARAHVLGPFHVDLAAIEDKYYCFVALGEDGQWSDIGERNVYELNCSTVWTGSNKIAKAFIKTIQEVTAIAEAYFKMVQNESNSSTAANQVGTNLVEPDDEEFDWEYYAADVPVKIISSSEGSDSQTEEDEYVPEEQVQKADEPEDDELDEEFIPEDEALRMIDEALTDVLDDIFSIQNFKELVKITQEVLKEREIDIFLKVGNKNLGAMFPESTVKVSAKGLDDSIFFADKAHWAYFDPEREGKPYKTTQIGLLEGPIRIALFICYQFLMKATLSLATEEGRKAAERNNLSLGLMVPILNFFRAVKAEDNDASSIAASAYLDGWQQIVDKYS